MASWQYGYSNPFLSVSYDPRQEHSMTAEAAMDVKSVIGISRGSVMVIEYIMPDEDAPHHPYPHYGRRASAGKF